MNVLVHWSDERVAEVAKRLGTPTPSRRDDVRRVLHEAEALPADIYRGAVEALRTIAASESWQGVVAANALADLGIGDPLLSAAFPRTQLSSEEEING